MICNYLKSVFVISLKYIEFRVLQWVSHKEFMSITYFYVFALVFGISSALFDDDLLLLSLNFHSV